MQITRDSTIVCLLAALIVGCRNADPPDFRQYVESIRRARMTESAQDELRAVASIRIGHASVSFPKDPDSGSYASSYRSNTCPNPNATPEEQGAFRDRARAEEMKEVAQLIPLADADSSGFVSTEEARDFRSLYEFGLKVSYVIGQEGGDPAAVAKGMGMSRDALMQWVSAYKPFAQSLKRLGGQAPPEVRL